MRRRNFIMVLASAAAYPLLTGAQQKAMPVIGFLSAFSPGPAAPFAAGVRRGLGETGYVEGQNVTIEYRWAEDHYDRLPALAADLVGRKVDVILASGGDAAAFVAKGATSTIPIVFAIGGDPVERGLVASLSRPGGNLTGISVLAAELNPKRLELLSELVPQARVATELVGMSPDAILTGGSAAVAALQQQTRTIPIVFTGVGDPVGQGFVQSLARPGGNITGFGANDPTLMGKWAQMLKEIAPRVTRVSVIFNPDTALFAPLFNREIEAVVPSLGITATLATVHDDAGIEEAIAAQAREPGGGLIILPDPFTVAHRDAIIAAASRHGLPLIGTLQYPGAGGLIAYWFNGIDLYAQAASYIDRILKGASPADLPVQQPTKYKLIINLKTAEALGLTVPPSMLDLADEVIE